MKQIQNIAITTMFLLSISLSPYMALADDDLPKVSGEIRKVKLKSRKITIKHEYIPNLDMPSMSMVFRVSEGIDISDFNKGDIVTITVVELEGKMVIMSIEKSE